MLKKYINSKVKASVIVKIIIYFFAFMMAITFFSRAYNSMLATNVIVIQPYESMIVTENNNKVLFNKCIPLESLNVGINEEYYIYIIEETETVLGSQILAKKINVDVINMDDNMVAVEGVSEWQEIIINSDKPIQDGVSVKRQN